MVHYYNCFKFQDKSLSDGIFFLELLSSVQPRAVNWGLVTKGVTGMFSFYIFYHFWHMKPTTKLYDSVNINLKTWTCADQEKMMNATYIISIARKLGCSIFLLPEDITEVVGINISLLLPLFSTSKYFTHVKKIN